MYSTNNESTYQDNNSGTYTSGSSSHSGNFCRCKQAFINECDGRNCRLNSK